MAKAPAILVVEDRGIVAGKIKRDLEGAGFAVIGMAATVARAAALAAELAIQGAVLDIDLHGEPVFPVAEVLRRRGLPFLFLTGFGREVLPPAWQTALLLEKPFDGEVLVRALRLALRGVYADPGQPRASTPAIRRAWQEVRHARDLVTEQRAWVEQALALRDPTGG